MSSRAFWKSKKIFMTGHTGFKGAWLAFWLREMGASVFGYSLPPENQSLYNILNIKDKLAGEKLADLSDVESLEKSLISFSPEIVLHLAAQSLVRRSYRDPRSTFETNVMGTVRVLEASRKVPSIRCLINVTTDKVYENRDQGGPFKETDPLGGHDPYSSSKACSEIVTTSYLRSFLSKPGSYTAATARAGNVVGGGDFNEDRLIPDFIRSLESGKAVEIRYPKSTRPWQHVLEPLSGYLQLAEALFHSSEYCGSWNFGPNEDSERTVENVAISMRKFFPQLQINTLESPEVFHEAAVLRLDIQKAVRFLNWHPKLSFEETMNWTSQWYQAFLSGEKDLDTITRKQIQEFETR